MESHNSELQDSHALTSFLVIDYLQKEGVSQHLLDKLSTEVPTFPFYDVPNIILSAFSERHL